MDIVINHRSAQYVDGCSHQYSVFKQPDWGNDKVVKHDGLCDGGYTVPDNCGPGRGGRRRGILQSLYREHSSAICE